MALKPFFVIPTPLGTVTSGNEAANRPAEHLGEFYYRGMVWQSTGNANLWVLCDLGSAQPIDFVGVLAANAQPGTTIQIRLGSTSSVLDYDSGALPFIDPAVTRDDGLYHSHHELPSLQTKRWLRIDIAGHTGDFQASMLVAGKKIDVSKYYETQWSREVRDLGSITFSKNGVPGVQDGEKLRATQFQLAWITEEEMENTLSPMDEKIGKTAPLFLSFDPQATNYRQRRTFFGFMEEQPEYQKVRYDTFRRDFRFLSLF